MSGLAEPWIPGFDPASGTLVLPLWSAAVVAALFVAFCVLMLGRAGRDGIVEAISRAGLLLVGAAVAWVVLDATSAGTFAAQRRALDARLLEMTTRAVMPGSALACLDATAGELVEASCEKALFATPEAAAASVAYVTAQLSLLADGSEFERRSGANYESALGSLRHAVEADRFGIVAHVLAQREGCTVEQCDPLSRLHDSSRVFANLRDRTFEEQVTKHMASWISPSRAASGEGPAVAAVAPVAPPAMVPANPTPAPATVSPRYDFPSAQSIPPVNIMAPEPPEPRQPAAASDAQTPAPGAANGRPATTPLPPRRPPRPAALRPEPPPVAGDTPVPAPPPVR